MRHYFAYIRVSTARQGEKGVSLQEQKTAILAYASRQGLVLGQWFEERETAAKKGRAVFNQMLRMLRRKKAKGVIIHKIDRGARNLRDWADLGSLIDAGFEVHFANESLDMTSRGGRLSADIQAVVAADFIRNLREETRKGFYGRLKQGLYPLPAPLGYLDMGGGKPKVPDPATAGTIRKLFEFYSTEKYSLVELVREADKLGLRTRAGKRISKNVIHGMLRNPFYVGVIRIATTNELFEGVHVPLISKRLFDLVQAILLGKRVRGNQRHEYVFRRLLICDTCRHTLTGERQKGHIYYRCHTKECSTMTVREDLLNEEMLRVLSRLRFSSTEQEELNGCLTRLEKKLADDQQVLIGNMKLRLTSIKEKRSRLTDAYIEDRIDKEVFETRNNDLLLEKMSLEEKLASVEESETSIPQKVHEFLGSCTTYYSLYQTGFSENRREIVRAVISNLLVRGKNIYFSRRSPFKEVENRAILTNGSPSRDRLRTTAELFQEIVERCRDMGLDA